MKYEVTISQLRWEYLAVTIEADSPEAAAAAAQARHEAGQYDSAAHDWDCGETHHQTNQLLPSEDIAQSPDYDPKAMP